MTGERGVNMPNGHLINGHDGTSRRDHDLRANLKLKLENFAFFLTNEENILIIIAGNEQSLAFSDRSFRKINDQKPKMVFALSGFTLYYAFLCIPQWKIRVKNAKSLSCDSSIEFIISKNLRLVEDASVKETVGNIKNLK